VGKVGGEGGEELVAEVGAEGLGRGGADLLEERGPELRGGVVDLGDVGGVDGVFEGGEVDAGKGGGEGVDGLEVVGLLRVAEVDDAEGGLGEGGLEGEDVGGVCGGLGFGCSPARVSILATWAT
jgi:hypothetical protein